MSVTNPGAPSPPPPPQAVLAQRYRLERRLAQGGMAEVWLGTDLSLSRQVAVKLLRANLAGDPVIAERFRREAIMVAQLSHPNIVAVYDAIDDGGRQAVVMQLINGKSLRQLLDEQKRLSPDLTMHIGSCVAAALDTAHRADLVHRDVKPGNILITPDGRVLLTDFGIAKGMSSDDDLTSAHVMMGTAKYLSPEQVRGKRLDGRADLYSLGLVLYECLAGRVPFLGETDADTALARLNRDPTDLMRLRPTLPYGLAPLIHQLLARKPEDRPATGADVRAELGRVAARPPDPTGDTTRDHTPVSARGTTPTPPLPRPQARTTSATPQRGTPVVPGRQPAAVGGYQPVRGGRPAGAPIRSERTPPSTTRPKQQPNRAFEDKRGPSLMIVGGLLLAALIVAAVLWNTVDDPAGTAPPTTVLPTVTTQPAEVALTRGIAGLTSYDPDGDDGTENDVLVPLAFDADPDTAWTTVCYSSKFLGGKAGVGLVADLGDARTGTLVAAIESSPYQVRVYASADSAIPTSYDDWGSPIASASELEAGVVTASLTSPARFVLISFVELGRSADCSSNPYQGRISDISFSAN
jgi:eukaryotic-like serine/threonine-protein kinase